MARRSVNSAETSTPTIRTVASHAGVGVGTVSRVLNGGPVSPEARARVNRAIQELGFSPLLVARGLAMRLTSTVGFVVNSTRGSWFAELLAGIEEALSPSRRSVVLASLRLTGEYDASTVEAWIQERRVDALLFVRSSRRERGLIQAARTAGLPVGLIAPDEHVRASVRVGCDNERGGELLAAHLLGLGHERFAFVCGPSGSRDTRDRVRGFERELHRNGHALPPSRLIIADSYYAEAARPFARAWLGTRASIRPTAVVLASDAMALGFMHELLDAGVRIPEDVSVAGFDDAPESAICWPGLTTVAQPTRRMAREACQALLRCVDGPDDPDVREYEVELVARRSCARPPHA